jgi:CheY-like chemotaxis protein
MDMDDWRENCRVESLADPELIGCQLQAVDDDLGSAELLVCGSSTAVGVQIAAMLRGSGFYRVAMVGSGAEALQSVARHAPKVLISSLVLSDMKFWAFVRALRTGQGYPRQLPIVALAEDLPTSIDLSVARELGVWLAIQNPDLSWPEVIAKAIEDTPKLQLLIVEDDPEFARLLATRLIGYDVQVAPTGEAGISAYRCQHFDLVVLDLRLPDMSGEMVLEAIHELNPSQPILVATGDAGSDVNLLQRGADQYLVKPLTVQSVQSACDQLWTQIAGLDVCRTADALKEHLYLANECLLSGRTESAHAHIQMGLNIKDERVAK